MKVVYGQTTLECADFGSIDHNGSMLWCCVDCHSRAPTEQLELSLGGGPKWGMIYIRPPVPPEHPEWSIDWSLHLCAHVCCHLVDHVLRLPHDWWKAKALEVKATESFNLHFYSHKDGSSAYKDSKEKGPAKVKRRSQEDPDEELRSGGLAAWKNR